MTKDYQWILDWLSPPRGKENDGPWLVRIADETDKIVTELLKLTPTANVKGVLYSLTERKDKKGKGTGFMPPIKLNSKDQTLQPMKVQVINKDTVDAALDILKNCNTKRVCILNFANETNPGSAWRSGVIAQEEDICRRTSLHLTLNKKFYPLRYEDAIYSTEVLVIRENFASQHKLFDVTRPETLPSISVISMAAIYAPKTDSGRTKYLDPVERDQMKSQIRLTLSIAAVNSHRYLVVGAFGCGHYKHPLQDSAQCWKEVLQEPEFSCRWEGIYFAITGGRNKNGISIYQEALDGLTV